MVAVLKPKPKINLKNMKTNFGTPLSRNEMKEVVGGKYAYSTCSTTCAGGGSVSSSCAGGCGSSTTSTWCNASDGSTYNAQNC